MRFLLKPLTEKNQILYTDTHRDNTPTLNFHTTWKGRGTWMLISSFKRGKMREKIGRKSWNMTKNKSLCIPNKERIKGRDKTIEGERRRSVEDGENDAQNETLGTPTRWDKNKKPKKNPLRLKFSAQNRNWNRNVFELEFFFCRF